MARTRVLIAGLGDSGLLTATHLARRRDLEVMGISTKPGLVSGQELGMRLAQPERWARDYRIPFDAFRRLDGVRTVSVTSGASVPDHLVTEVLAYLAERGYPDARAVQTAEETLAFSLPKELHRDLKAAGRSTKTPVRA